MRISSLIPVFVLFAAGPVWGCGGTGEDLAGPSKPVDGGTSDAPEEQDAGQNDGAVQDAAGDGAVPDAVADATPPSCAPPADSSLAALCVSFEPEVLDLIDGDERFDGQGVLLVQVFDTAEPELPDGSQVDPLVEVRVPDQPGGGAPATMGVYDPLAPIRFGALPATVYVRAMFIDNFDAFSGEALAAGLWLGGWDFTQGLFADESLQPVSLTVGQGVELTMPMTALRSAKVTLTKSFLAQPRGNGEGPAGFVLFESPDIAANPTPRAWGVGEVACGSIHEQAGIDVEGIFIGEEPLYGLGYLDDYGQGIEDSIPPGTMVNVGLTGGQPALPESSKITVPSGAYRIEASLELTVTVPFQSLPPTDSVSCP